MFEKEIIDAGYKTLAKKHHPDKGGRAEDFQALQAARGNLIGILSNWQDWQRKGGASDPPPRVVYPAPGPPPIVPGSRHTVDDVIDLAGKIVDIFGSKLKRRRTAGNRKSQIANHK